jgi:hypothetical protein
MRSCSWDRVRVGDANGDHLPGAVSPAARWNPSAVKKSSPFEAVFDRRLRNRRFIRQRAQLVQFVSERGDLDPNTGAAQTVGVGEVVGELVPTLSD